MSQQTKRGRFERNKKRLRGACWVGDATVADRDAILEFLAAKDPEDYTETDPDDSGKSDATLKEYASKLRLASVRSTIPLTEMDADDVNTLMSDYRQGTKKVLDPAALEDDPNAPKSTQGIGADGMSQGGVRATQSVLRKFYEYHDDLAIEDKEDIQLESLPDTSVDEQEMFDQEEIEALRSACSNARDRCLVELLLNTGQRITALLTLRVRDVDVDEGVYYLNGDAKGLKGADQNGKKRPLLGARASVRDWLQNYHPCPDDPNAALLTSLPGQAVDEPGAPLAPQYVNQRLRDLGKRAGVDKPTNAHAWRHNFVTIAHRVYDMDKETIRHLIGHGDGSKVMETTYKHLSDEDYIEAAEESMGIREPSEKANLTPAVCNVCQEPLEPNWKACPACAEVYAPDADEVVEDISEETKQDYKKREPTNGETMAKLDKLDELMADPTVKAALLEKLADE